MQEASCPALVLPWALGCGGAGFREPLPFPRSLLAGPLFRTQPKGCDSGLESFPGCGEVQCHHHTCPNGVGQGGLVAFSWRAALSSLIPGERRS